MINKENEYQKVIRNHKRWAKHWTTASAHRSHSSTINMIAPAEKALDFIKSLIDNPQIDYSKKTTMLIEFYDNENSLERSQGFMGSGFYFDAAQVIKKQKEEIENGKEATIFKMPKS